MRVDGKLAQVLSIHETFHKQSYELVLAPSIQLAANYNELQFATGAIQPSELLFTKQPVKYVLQLAALIDPTLLPVVFAFDAVAQLFSKHVNATESHKHVTPPPVSQLS